MGTENVPLFKRGQERLIDDNVVNNRNVCVKGVENYVDPSAKNIDINGDNNFVFSGSENILITGNGNSVEGAKDVTLINTNNVQVVNSGVTYINNEIQGVGSVVTISSSVTADESISTYLGDTSSGNIVAVLPSTAIEGKVWNFKKIDEANVFELRVTLPITIDGETQIQITQIQTCISVQWDGAQYKII